MNQLLKYTLHVIIALSAISLSASMVKKKNQDESDKLKCSLRGLHNGLRLHSQERFAESIAILSGSLGLIENLDSDIAIKSQIDLKHALFYSTFISPYPLPNYTQLSSNLGYDLIEKAYRASRTNNKTLEQQCLQHAHDLFSRDIDISVGYILEKLKNNSFTDTSGELYIKNHCIKIMQKNTHNMLVQCALAKIFAHGEYNQPKSIDNALFYCQKFILEFAQQPSFDTFPLKHSTVSNTLSDLWEIDYKAKTLLAYYYFLYADKQKNENKMARATMQLLPNRTRPTILKLIQSQYVIEQSTLNKINAYTLSDSDFIELLESDGHILIPLLQQELTSLENCVDPKTDAIHRTLGLYEYHHKRFANAREHFTQCTTYRDDLYAQSLLIIAPNSSPVNFLNDLRTSLSLLKKKHSMSRDDQAKTMIMSKIHEVGPRYVKSLLRNFQYSYACQLTECLMQLPEMRKSACDLFLCIEKNMSQLPEKQYDNIQRSGAYNALYAYLQEIATSNKHKPYACQTLAQVADERIKCPWTPKEDIIKLKKDYLDHATCTLNHKNILTQDQKNKCAAYALEIGICEKSVTYLDRAMEYGNVGAYFHKAILLNEKDQDYNAPLILELFEKHIATKDSYRHYSYELLGVYYHKSQNHKLAIKYLEEAAKLGNCDGGHMIADYYMSGIKNDDGTWYLEPDKTKAREYLNQTIIGKSNLAYTQSLYSRILLDYSQNEYENVCEDCNTYLACQNIADIEKTACLFVMGAVKMLDCKDRLTNIADVASMITLCIPQLRQAREQFDSHLSQEYVDIITSLLHSKADFVTTMSNALRYVVEHNIISDNALDFCYIMSHLCGLSRITDKETDELAVQTLKYTAENNHLDSQLFLQNVASDSLSAEEKIYYLEKAKFNNPHLAANMQKRLDNAYPLTIAEQARLIDLLIKKSDSEPLLHNYLSHMYGDNRLPVILLDTKQKALGQSLENIIEACLNNTLLNNLVTSFLKNPTKQSELHAIMFVASLLFYSNNPQHLLQAAYYLSAVQKYLQRPNDCIEYNLGIIYYKLGQHHLEKKPCQYAKAVYYMQKSADLFTVPAQICLSELWLNHIPEAQKIEPSTVFKYLQLACSDNKDPHPHTLLKRYYEQTKLLMPENCPIPSDIADAKIESFMEGIDLMNKLAHHPLCATILDFTKGGPCPDFDHASKLVGTGFENNIKAFALFQKMADQKPQNPHACLMLTLCGQNLETTQRMHYLTDGLTHGITQSKEKNGSLFHDRIILVSVFRLIYEIMSQEREMSALPQKNRQQKALTQKTKMLTITVLKTIKDTLTQLNVNLTTFVTLYKHMYGQDLTKQTGWK